MIYSEAFFAYSDNVLREPQVTHLQLLARYAQMHPDEVTFIVAIHLLDGTEHQKKAAFEMFASLKSSDCGGLSFKSQKFLDIQELM